MKIVEEASINAGTKAEALVVGREILLHWQKSFQPLDNHQRQTIGRVKRVIDRVRVDFRFAKWFKEDNAVGTKGDWQTAMCFDYALSQVYNSPPRADHYIPTLKAMIKKVLIPASMGAVYSADEEGLVDQTIRVLEIAAEEYLDHHTPDTT